MLKLTFPLPPGLKRVSAAWLLVLIVLPAGRCASQQEEEEAAAGKGKEGVNARTDSAHARLAGASALQILSADSGLVGGFHPKKSPWLAVGLSAIAPGAGQIYDESYWKAPLIWGVGGYWVSQWISLADKYQDFRSLYAQSLQTSSVGNEQYRRLRDFYRDERDRFAWFLGALYFLNLVDAYVGAHLYDFDVSPQLTSDGRRIPQVRATLRLPLESLH